MMDSTSIVFALYMYLNRATLCDRARRRRVNNFKLKALNFLRTVIIFFFAQVFLYFSKFIFFSPKHFLSRHFIFGDSTFNKIGNFDGCSYKHHFKNWQFDVSLFENFGKKGYFCHYFFKNFRNFFNPKNGLYIGVIIKVAKI